ncbi:VOC family protein [Herbiconiux sp. P17]|uniref:VOC family protein n=1 Tax=Herbiconiux wuyangfengii TaxID=3342794 RepID=UPI0035BAB9FD
MTSSHGYPAFRQVVLDTEDARALAEFYHHLLALPYQEGDEPPLEGPDPLGEDWLVLLGPDGQRLLAFQQVASMPPPTWPEGPRPQMLHLDFSVPDREQLLRHRERALLLGATLLREELDDPDEPISIFADPSGHPFCVFVIASS